MKCLNTNQKNLAKKHKVYSINAMEEAEKIGNVKAFNVIVLGLAVNNGATGFLMQHIRRPFHEKMPAYRMQKKLYSV